MALHLIQHPDPNPEPQKLILDDFLPARPAVLVHERKTLGDFYDDGFHIVICGYIALTHLSHFFEFTLKMKQPEQERILRPLIDGDETKTIFPEAPVTILPYRPNIEGDRATGKAGFTVDDIEKHLRRAFEIEFTTVNSGKIVFSFLDLQQVMLRYRNLTDSLLRNDYAEHDLEVFMWSYDNSEFSGQAAAEQDAAGQPATPP